MLKPFCISLWEKPPKIPPSNRSKATRRGLTLVELLVALTVSLVMIFAVIEIFSRVGSRVSDGRATIEMAGEIRAARELLERDLEGMTCPAQPWVDPAASKGYFEYVEGPSRDSLPAAGDTTLGDIDDVLMFTARSQGEPFTGRFNNTIVESDVAEIVWWLSRVEKSNPINNTREQGEFYRLHRRVLLVRPDLNVSGTEQDFYANNDISVSAASGSLKANSLGDLTMRQNRFAHNRGSYPFALNRTTLTNLIQSGGNLGSDVVLSNVLGFDIKAYDPYAKVTASDVTTPLTATALVPGDPAYSLYVGGGPPPSPPPPPPLPPPFTVDNADPGFSQSGWTYYGSAAGGSNGGVWYYYNGNGTHKAAWTATITPGTYSLGASWYAYPQRNTAATYRVYDGSTLVASKSVNQTQLAQPNLTAGGINYQYIAQNVVFSSTTLRVELLDGPSYTVADAIRVVKTANPPQPPPPPATSEFHIGRGAYVDLNYLNATGSDFSAPASSNSGLGSTNDDNTYDTWPTTNIDATGVDGLDNSNSGAVDDAAEYGNKVPPYSANLRGIEVQIRVIEPDTLRVRQTRLQAYLQN